MCIKQLFSINRDILCSMPDIIIKRKKLVHDVEEQQPEMLLIVHTAVL